MLLRACNRNWRRGFSAATAPISSTQLVYAPTSSNNLARPIEFNKFDWQDPLKLESQLTEDEKLIGKSTRDYCQSKLFPRVLEGFRHESKPDR